MRALLILLLLSIPALAVTPVEKRKAFDTLFPPYHAVPAEAQAWLDRLKKGEVSGTALDREKFFAEMPEYFKRYAVRFYKSSSNQFASPENPRQVFFSPDGTLEVAFGGDPVAGEAEARGLLKKNPEDAFAKRMLTEALKAQKNDAFNLVEIQALDRDALFAAHYHEVLSSSRFASLHFKKDGRPHLDWNPTLCADCHSRELADKKLPKVNVHNWPGYPNWPGQYGSVDDKVRKGSREDTFLAALSARLEKAKVLRSTEEGMVSWLAEKKEAGKDQPNHWQLSQMGTIFSNVLAANNAERIARALATRPEFPRLKYALLAALNNCSPIESFVPEATKASFKLTYEGLRTETENKLFEYQKSLIAQLEPLAQEVPEVSKRSYFLKDDVTRVASVRYIVENGFGLDTSAWFFTLPSDVFETGSANFDSEMAVAVKKEILFAANRGMNDMSSFPFDKCEWLKSKAVAPGGDGNLKDSEKAGH